LVSNIIISKIGVEEENWNVLVYSSLDTHKPQSEQQGLELYGLQFTTYRMYVGANSSQLIRPEP
jgi:hypothetical protein